MVFGSFRIIWKGSVPWALHTRKKAAAPIRATLGISGVCLVLGEVGSFVVWGNEGLRSNKPNFQSILGLKNCNQS